MKLALHLAYKNLIGAGLRTWLNAGVLSFSFVIILFFNGLMDGWNQQARKDGIEWEYGQGQLIHEDFDPNDPFTIQDGHGILPVVSENLTPILLRQASIYPDGRMLSAVLKGIQIDQTTLKLPTHLLAADDVSIPAIIGKRMASATNLEVGESVLMRWRDKNGTFDAQEVTIVGIFDCNVATIDQGQIWIPIARLRALTGMPSEATMYVSSTNDMKTAKGWYSKSQEELLIELTRLIEAKKVSSSIVYLLLMAIALLAIFDTQVLSIFRRQREIGTYMALGMTRWQVVGLFTIEGSMYSFFAMILGSVYGIPFLYYLASTGIGMPAASQDMGVAVADRIYPVYGLMLILGTILLVVISATIVSFIPAKKIAKMNPVDAIKGKIQ